MFGGTRKKLLRAGVGVVLLAGAVSVQTASADVQGHGPCAPRELYVSTQGNDKADGSAKHPWQTVQHARDEISGHGWNSANQMRCDIHVNLAAGDYPVTRTVSFDEGDSGANGHQVVYRSADGPGKARLLGGAPITGWQPYQGNIYKAPFDKTKPFYTLFENGDRATLARYPNRATPDTWAPYLTSALPDISKEAVHNWLWSNPGDWDPSWDLSQASLTIWSGGSWSWFTDTVPILDVNFAKNQLTMKYNTRYALHNSGGGSRYFLQNSLSFLDQPGEFYVDYKNGEVYYWPENGAKPTDSSVIRPTVQTVVDVAGSSPEHRAHDITFDGLGVQYSDYVEWYRNGWINDGDSGDIHQYPQYDRQVEMPRDRFGAVRVTNTSHVTLKNAHISETGFTAVYALFANDHFSVTDSLIDHIGADGIKVEGGYPGEGDISNYHLFTDNYIHHFGELVPGDASGVELMDTGHNEVSYSVIDHSARYAVSLEARPEVQAQDDYAQNNTFKYLNLQEAGLDSGDMGAFYTYGVDNFEPHTLDNYVSQVVIGDVIPDASMPDSGTRGVHMDAGGCGFSFTDIEVGKVTDDKYQSYQCNTVTNANWADGFDQSRMQYDKIGVTAAFPYPRPPATVSPAK
ncbi:right-handed parallel beta-helix repeat-containing protein [Amycolatopsis sp. NPDC051903]|uniref:right-handed parallel beta-helix repeat-containing protein n=1 Tax=Amycolatopsis sp. NPDC051903 TaxID=3363936 RepID=UPI0037B9C399